MGASITFLGTGTGSTVVGRGTRCSAGIIVTLDDNQFYIDPGVGAVVKAAEYGVSLRGTTAVLVSHAHLNHAAGLPAVLDVMSHSGLDRHGVLIANKTVLQGSDEYAPAVSAFYRAYVERYIAVDRGQRIGINDIEIQTLTARHSDPNSLGFKLFGSSMTVVYTGDTVYAADIAEQYKGANVLILNVPNKQRTTTNLCAEDAVAIIRRVRPNLAIVTHFGQEMVRADPLYEVREIQKATGVQTLAAKDGLVVRPGAFSTVGQKTMVGYKEEVES